MPAPQRGRAGSRTPEVLEPRAASKPPPRRDEAYTPPANTDEYVHGMTQRMDPRREGTSIRDGLRLQATGPHLRASLRHGSSERDEPRHPDARGSHEPLPREERPALEEPRAQEPGSAAVAGLETGPDFVHLEDGMPAPSGDRPTLYTTREIAERAHRFEGLHSSLDAIGRTLSEQ